MSPSAPTSRQPQFSALRQGAQRSWARLRSFVRDSSPESDDPMIGSGRITMTVIAGVIACGLAINAVKVIASIVGEGALPVIVQGLPSGAMALREMGSLRPRGGGAMLYTYVDVPMWALVAIGVAAFAYLAALVWCVVRVASLCVATGAWQTQGDPWSRVVSEARRLRGAVMNVIYLGGIYGMGLPAVLTPRVIPDADSVVMTLVPWASYLLIWAILLVGTHILAFVTSAMARLHRRSLALDAENSELRAVTEGLV